MKPTVATAGAACLLACLIALGCRTRDTLVYPGVSLKIAMLTPAAGSTISRSIDHVPVRATITYITPRDGGGLLIVNVLDKDNLVDSLGTSERSYELPAGATGTVEYSDTIVVTPSVRTVRLSAFLWPHPRQSCTREPQGAVMRRTSRGIPTALVHLAYQARCPQPAVANREPRGDYRRGGKPTRGVAEAAPE